MKKSYLIYTGILAVLAYGCADNETATLPVPTDGIRIHASLPATRIVMEEGDDVTHSLWEEDDMIGLFSNGQENLYYRIASTDGTNAEFTPAGPEYALTADEGEPVYAYAPYEYGTTAEVVPFSTVNMYRPLVYAEGTVNGQELDLAFRHAMAYLKITLDKDAFPQIAAPVLNAITVSSPDGLTGEGTFNLKTHTYSLTQEATYRGGPTEATDLSQNAWESGYIPVVPGKDGKIDIMATVNGRSVLVTSRHTPQGGFLPGAVYTLSPNSEDFILRIILSEKTMNITADGGPLEVNLQTNTDIDTQVLDADWITRMNTRSLTAQSVTFHAEPNTTTESRTAHIVFRTKLASDSETGELNEPLTTAIDTLTVVQSAYEQSLNLNVTQAGTLSTLISADDKNSITHLTLSGQLNGDDIRYLREMNQLQALDLGQADIVSGGEAYYKNYRTADHIVGNYMFNGLGLQSITLPQSSTEVGQYALAGNDLVQVSIPDGVTAIGTGCFEGVYTLESITLPPSLTSIADRTFMNCFELHELHISDLARWCEVKLATEYSHPFADAGNYSGGTGGGTIYLNGEAITDLHIPASVAEVGDFTFMDCKNITSVTIDNGPTYIGERAFYGCGNIKSVSLPGSVTQIGGWAFSGTAISNISLPEGVEELGQYVFYDCKQLRTIDIPTTLKSIGTAAFSDCNALQTVNLTEGLVTIGATAFYQCAALDGITLPESVTTIGRGAFEGCSSLSSINIPASVTGIGANAFRYCSSLSSLYIDNLERWCHITFNRQSIGDSSGNPMQQAKDVYFNGERLTELVIPENVTTVKAFAFTGLSQLASVNLKQTGRVEREAFSYCGNLETVRSEAPTAPILTSTDAFHEIAAGCKLYVREEAYDSFLTSNWAEIFSNIISE